MQDSRNDDEEKDEDARGSVNLIGTIWFGRMEFMFSKVARVA